MRPIFFSKGKEHISEISCRVQQKFYDKIKIHFSDNLHFAFIFGSFAKGYAKQDHDIDMFICLKQRDLLKERQFIIWSKNLHLQYGLKPDIQYPAEIMTLTDLNEAISYIDVVELELKNNSQKLFDYTTWIQILADKKIAMMGDLQLLNELSIKCQQFPELWKKQILTKLQSQDPLFFLKRVISFEQNNSIVNNSPDERPYNDYYIYSCI